MCLAKHRRGFRRPISVGDRRYRCPFDLQLHLEQCAMRHGRPGQQLAAPVEVQHRFLVGQALKRNPSGRAMVADGRFMFACGFEMRCQLHCERRRTIAETCFQSSRDAPVPRLLAGLADLGLPQLLVQCVNELEPRRVRAIWPLFGSQPLDELLLARETQTLVLDAA